MTNEKAIKFFEEQHKSPACFISLEEWRDFNDALDLAIEAIRKQDPKKPNETTDRAWGIECKQAVCPNCDCYLGMVHFICEGDKKKTPTARHVVRQLTGRDGQMSDFGDTVSRKAAIDTVTKHYRVHDNDLLEVIAYEIEQLPSAEQPNSSEIPNSSDMVSRQATIDAVVDELDRIDHVPQWVFDALSSRIKSVPSAEPEPLSQAYARAVWTWLLNYQIKSAELKGAYSPYEVLSWVTNDWRKENGLDKQAGSD